MTELIKGVGGLELTFLVFAIVGTLFFLFRLVAMILGGFGTDGGDVDLGAGHSPDMSHSAQLEGAESSFKLVSVNSITGFFMMFGWAGLTAYRQFHAGPAGSAAVGLIAGLLTMVATGALFKAMMKLQSRGDDFVIQKAIGAVGTVYEKIPAKGRGQVKVICGGVSRIVDAISRDSKDIDSFTDVRVVEVSDPRTVVVKRV